MLKQKIAQNFLISIIGRVAASALGLVSFAFITRGLGLEGFGDYSIIFAFLYIFSVFADFGFYNILTREISKPDADEKSIIANAFIARLILLILFLGFSLLLVFFTPYSFQAKIGVFIAVPGIAFLSLSQVLMGVFQKHLKTLIPALADIFARVIQLALVFYLYKTNANLQYFVLAFVFGSVFNFAIIYYFARKYTEFRLRLARFPKILAILKESWPLAISSVLVLIYFKGDTIILSLMKPPEDVGIYNVAYRILENIIFFPAMFVGLVMPLLSNYFVLDINKFKSVFQKTFDFLVVIGIPLAVGGVYLAPHIMNIISGSGFEQSYEPFRVLMFAMIFIFFGSLFGNAIIAIHKQKEVMYVYGAAAVFNVLGNLYFIWKYSYLGAAWMTAATEIFVSFLMFWIIYKTIGYLPDLRVFGKAILGSLCMYFILLVSPWQSFLILFPLGIAVYFIFMYLAKGITKEDTIQLLQSIKIKN